MSNLYLAMGTEPQSTAGLLVSFLPLILMFVVFYFILIRPQKKRDKEIQKMRESIEVGDEIITAGGIIGLVVSIKDENLVIETAGDRSKIRIARWAIQHNSTAAERHAQVQAEAQEEKLAKKNKE